MDKQEVKDANVFQFDLAKYDVLQKSNEGVEVELVMEGKKTNIWLRILGADADAVMEAVFENQTRRMNEMASNGGKMTHDASVLHKENTAQLAAAVVSWSWGKEPWTGTIPYAGKMLPHTPENVLNIFKGVPAVRELADKTVSKKELFYKG